MKKKIGSIKIIALSLVLIAGYGIYRIANLGFLKSFTTGMKHMGSGKQKYSSTEQFDYDISSNLDLHTDVGSITIQEWNKPSAHLTITKKAAYKEDLEDLPVTINHSSEKLTVTSTWNSKHQNCSVNFVLSVPKKIKTITARTDVGDIRLSQVDADIKLISNVGNLEVTQINGTGTVDTQTDVGNISVTKAGGPVIVKTDVGNITIADVIKVTDAKTDTGEIYITRAGGPVTAKTNCGSIYITKTADNPHEPKAKTNMGSVTIKTVKE